MRPSSEPSARAASIPPLSSIRPNSAQAAWARSSVSFSTAYEPPAGSATWATCDSEISRLEVLRAIRRPNVVRQPEHAVERQHRHRVGSAHPGGEGRDRGAEHVDPGVVLAHHRAAGHDVLSLAAVVGRGRAELGDPGPEPAGRTELRDRRELLVGRGVPELQETERLVEREAGPGERAQVRRPRGQAVAELLAVGRAEVVDRGGVDDDPEGAGLAGELGDADQRSVPAGRACRDHTPHQCREGVGAEVGPLGRGHAAGAEQRDERLRGGDRVGGRVEHDRGEVEQHVVEQCGEIVGSDAGTELDPQGGGPVLEVDQRGLVAVLGAEAAQVAADVPVTGPGRPAGGAQVVQQRGRAERGDADAVEGGAGELAPHQVVGVVLAHPPGLAEHRGRGLLPVAGPEPVVVGTGQLERTLLGLELRRLREPTMDVSHGANDRSPTDR